MNEFWAVVGSMLLNLTFHERIFQDSAFGRDFDFLENLRLRLRRELRLNLGRWQVMKLNEIISQRIVDGRPVAASRPELDNFVLDVRRHWTVPLRDFHVSLHLYAVVGLAAMDREFRRLVHVASQNADDPEVLHRLLNSPEGETPRFVISMEESQELRQFFRVVQAIADLEGFHQANWVQPMERPLPCDSGFTKDPHPFRWVSQNRVFLLPEMTKQLEEAKAIL